jgi:hypothetical protein
LSSRSPTVGETKAGGDVLGAAGLLLSVVAWTHIALILFPAHFGTAPWEFAAASQTVEVLPLGATGAALLAYVSIMRGWRNGATALAILCIASALLSVGVAVFMALDVMVAWNSVVSTLRENVAKTAAKALFMAVLFTAYFSWLATRVLRARRAAARH